MEQPKSTKGSTARSPATEDKNDENRVAGLFDLELPVSRHATGKQARVDLDTAIRLCEEYREWFDLHEDLAAARSEERCRVEFVL